MRTIPVIALSACACLAYAGVTSASDGLTSAFVEPSGGVTLTIDISGSEFWDLQGSSFNTFMSIYITPWTVITGIGWDLSLSTVGESWASEATIGFQDQIFVTPGEGDDFPTTFARYQSGGIIDLHDAGFDWIVPDSEGNVNLEFFETFDDQPGAIDAHLLSGSRIFLRLPLPPAPGSTIALSLGLLCCSRRRR